MNNNKNICTEVTLSPPWYILRDKFAYTIGLSPCVTVSQLKPMEESNYLLQFNVSDKNIAMALREIIFSMYNFGNVNVITEVIGPNNESITGNDKKNFTPEEVACIICCAFYKNPLFIGCILDKTPFGLSVVAPIIKEQVIKFYSDDLSDYCLNFLEVASKLLNSILITTFNKVNEILVIFTTEDTECLKGKTYFCQN